MKSSFFGAVDTAGFPKDMYWLFRSQWTQEPMVHLLPMNWTDYKPGQNVQVWAYANVDTVELFLNGQSLGVRTFDHKTTTDGRAVPGDDRVLRRRQDVHRRHLPGQLPEPERQLRQAAPDLERPLRARQARRRGRARTAREVARDEIDTAGAPDTVKLTPDKQAIAADGHSLSYVTVDVVDKDGVMVPSADNELHLRRHAAASSSGLDNGQEESAENYKSSTRAAFNGKALAIVQSGDRGARSRSP